MAEAEILAPVSGKARIDILDILRGIAILGIFFMNIPFMGQSIAKLFVDTTAIGWSPGDQASWFTVQLLLEGTQRGLLEMLFGAGMMVLAAKAMTPDGPVAVADLYWRRNLWLLAFGLADIFVLLWAGDILHIYALAALFLFPFRKLNPRLLLLLGLGYAAFVMVTGGMTYMDRLDLTHRVAAVEQKQAAHAPLTAADRATMAEWQKTVERRHGGEEMKQVAADEAKGHAGGYLAYARMHIGLYLAFLFPSLVGSVAEALCVMMIGVALWKWQVIQGGRSARFYLVLMLLCYAAAMPMRWVAAHEYLSMVPIPRTGAFTYEIGRILMSAGHVALINLAVKSGLGRTILAPFKAAGRTAFSLYFMQQIVGLWILFSPWGVGLWGKLSWIGLYAVVLVTVVLQLVIANLWVRFFASGPLEWLWRSLSYVRWQPFRNRVAD